MQTLRQAIPHWWPVTTKLTRPMDLFDTVTAITFNVIEKIIKTALYVTRGTLLDAHTINTAVDCQGKGVPCALSYPSCFINFTNFAAYNSSSVQVWIVNRSVDCVISLYQTVTSNHVDNIRSGALPFVSMTAHSDTGRRQVKPNTPSNCCQQRRLKR